MRPRNFSSAPGVESCAHVEPAAAAAAENWRSERPRVRVVSAARRVDRVVWSEE